MNQLSRRGRFTRFALSLIGVAALAACGGGGDAEVVATTTTGRVLGAEASGMRAFLGIPYAKPPVGTLRWKAPVAVDAWTDTRSARAFGPHCPQPTTAFGTASTSEDCLYLNVYTPTAPGPHPVMVWIHGGAFYLGQSDGYDPRRLVEQGIVVVTLNYRLGALGFMSHPALSAEQNNSSGNYGLMDQQAALRWVQANIANFNGDKNNVTIFGESAGGFSVHSHLASSGSTGLFHKAIIQSGAYALAGQDTLAAAEAKGQTVATAAGALLSQPACTTADCLRALPVSALLGAQMAAWPSGPIPSVDGTVLPQSVATRLAMGTYNKVPVMQGSTKNEWALFVALDEMTPVSTAAPWKGSALNATTYPQSIAGTFPFLAGQAAGLANVVYPAAAYGGNPSVAMSALGTDLLFACTGRTSNLLQSTALAATGTKLYAYEFADDGAPKVNLGKAASFERGAEHTSELAYLFNMATLTTAQQGLSDSMVGYWTRFARNGNPNTTAAPNAWPAFSGLAENVLTLKPGAIAVNANFATDHKCTTVWATPS